MKDYKKLREDFNKYRYEVTNYSYLANKPKGKYHLDHIFPVNLGFYFDVPPKRLAHPNNLQWLDAYTNVKEKGFLTDISYNQFLENTKEWENFHYVKNNGRHIYEQKKQESWEDLLNRVPEIFKRVSNDEYMTNEEIRNIANEHGLKGPVGKIVTAKKIHDIVVGNNKLIGSKYIGKNIRVFYGIGLR